MTSHDPFPIDPLPERDPGHLVLDDPAPPRRSPSRAAVLGVAAAVLLTVGAGAGAWGAVALSGGSTEATSASGSAPGTTTNGGQGTGGQGSSGAQGSGGQGSTGNQGFGGGQGFGGSQGFGGRGSGGTGSGSGTSSAQGTAATAAQTSGVVTIDTRLGYESAEAAGTGIILTSSGRILTNNHVIDGSTAITVTVESTGRRYPATVVGTDSSKDVAVLQLTGANGLTPARISAADVEVGDAVTAVGNAGGTGDLTAASGSVTATDQPITTEAEGSSAGESLTGMIETDADVVSGDSGGPLVDAAGRVVGITTAATSGTDDPTGYAIPIDTATAIATRISAGDHSDGITLGLPAFLGVSISPDGDGAVVADVLDGTPAASSKLAAGDTITAVDGDEIDSASALTKAIRSHRPGERVEVAYTTSTGTSATTVVTLVEGPAD